jgi:hypothetical protein
VRGGRRLTGALLLALLLQGAAGTAGAQTGPSRDIVATGRTALRRAISPADLAALPPVTLHIGFAKGLATDQGSFTGPLLWAALGRAGLIPAGPRKTRLTHIVRIAGRDGYAVVLALAEIDPDFANKPVILATQENGRPIDGGGIRLVVPGDRHGGRSVRDVVAVAVE